MEKSLELFGFFSVLMLVAVVMDLRSSKRAFSAIEHRIFIICSIVALVQLPVSFGARNDETFQLAFFLAFTASLVLATTVAIHFVSKDRTRL